MACDMIYIKYFDSDHLTLAPINKRRMSFYIPFVGILAVVPYSYELIESFPWLFLLQCSKASLMS